MAAAAAAAAAVNAAVKYAAMNRNCSVTLDYDDYLSDDSVNAVANRKSNLRFAVLAYAVAVFDALDFQASPYDLCRHVNLAKFHFVAHDSFATKIEKIRVKQIGRFFAFRLAKTHSPDGIDQCAFDLNQTIASNPNVTISNPLYLGQSNPVFFFK